MTGRVEGQRGERPGDRGREGGLTALLKSCDLGSRAGEKLTFCTAVGEASTCEWGEGKTRRRDRTRVGKRRVEAGDMLC